jgi:hypothetical protein
VGDVAAVQRIRKYVTPAAHMVWAIGEKLTLWDDCSRVSLPPVRQDGVDALESGIDVEGGVVDARIFGEGGSDTHVVVDFREERCRTHPALGPIIEHLLNDLEPPLSPVPTAPVRFDLIGRLDLTQVIGECSTIVEADGTTWEIVLSPDYLQPYDGAPGDLQPPRSGRSRGRRPGSCLRPVEWFWPVHGQLVPVRDPNRLHGPGAPPAAGRNPSPGCATLSRVDAADIAR